jgi:flagellar basal-body rod protein FlgB
LPVGGRGIELARDPPAMIRALFDGAVEALTRGLSYAGRRHEVLSRNIANADTPGYRAQDLVFDDLWRPPAPDPHGEIAASLLPVGRAERRPRLVYTGDGAWRPAGNDVKVEEQLARLAENQLYHQALAQTLASQFAALKQAISGRV